MCFVDTSAAGAERAVDVRMHEVRVHEIRRASRSANASRQTQVEIARRWDALGRDTERVVERIGRTGRIVEAEKADVDSALRERGQQRQQVALGPADAADSMNVENLHARRRRRESAQSSAAAASSAIRKSVATR